jgi:hypothetical protein
VALLEDTEEVEVAVDVADKSGLYADEGLVAKAERDVLEVLVLELGGGGGGVEVEVEVVRGLECGVYACWVVVVGGGVYSGVGVYFGVVVCFGVVVVGFSSGGEPEPNSHEPVSTPLSVLPANATKRP